MNWPQAHRYAISKSDISNSDTLETIELAYRNGCGAFVSHRSGETGDTIISDLTVAVNAGLLKTGSASRGE